MGRPRKYPIDEQKEAEVVFTPVDAAMPEDLPVVEPENPAPAKSKLEELMNELAMSVARGLVITPDDDGVTFSRGNLSEWVNKTVPMQVMVGIGKRIAG